MAKNLYVLDTCVVLSDPSAFEKFGNNDVYLPLEVIDELDNQKTRSDDVGWKAREVFRYLAKLSLEDLKSARGVVVNPSGGKLFVYNSTVVEEGVIPTVIRSEADSAVIITCLALKAVNLKKKVALVTHDMSLRIRASSWGVIAEDYRQDMAEETPPYTGSRTVIVNNGGDWSKLWSSEEMALKDFSDDTSKELKDLSPNEFVFFTDGKTTCLAMFKKGRLKVLKDKAKPSFMDMTPRNLEQRCAVEVLADPSIPLVILTGAAGVGKTLLTLAVALDKIVDKGEFAKIVMIKPMIAVGGKDIGFLPGDKTQKVASWLGPMRDNIDQIMGKESLDEDSPFDKMLNDGVLEAEAMALIQGRSIQDSFIIVDEAQNLSPREARMIVERCGKNSKVILLGDLSQVENRAVNKASNGLYHAMQGGKAHDLVGIVNLTKVERSELAKIASLIFSNPSAQG